VKFGSAGIFITSSTRVENYLLDTSSVVTIDQVLGYLHDYYEHSDEHGIITFNIHMAYRQPAD
jgi:hypothetical protein